MGFFSGQLLTVVLNSFHVLFRTDGEGGAGSSRGVQSGHPVTLVQVRFIDLCSVHPGTLVQVRFTDPCSGHPGYTIGYRYALLSPPPPAPLPRGRGNIGRCHLVGNIKLGRVKEEI